MRAVIVARHHRVGALGAQRFDPGAISDGLQVAYRLPLPGSAPALTAG